MSWLLPLLRGPARAVCARRDRLLRDPAAAQARVRAKALRQHALTAVGRADGADRHASFHDLPVRSWEDWAPWLAEEARTPGTAFARAPRFWEPTSGSTGPRKSVPIPPGTLAAFTTALLWQLADTLVDGPPLRTGRLHVSASPPLTGEVRDDTDYVEGWAGRALRPWLVTAPQAQAASTAEAFWAALATRLAHTPDLEAVSVWSPTFFHTVLDVLEADPTLAPAALRPAVRAQDWACLWPQLRLLSCWADAQAARPAATLAARLPSVALQPKGLLATEGPVTVPLWSAGAAVPLVNDVLVELRDDQGRVHALTEAAQDTPYELVLTVPGGLVRYVLGDRVALGPPVHATPTLRLLGRSAAVCDLVGEKLHEDWVSQVLAATLPQATTATLLPFAGPPAHYLLLTDTPVSADQLAQIDRALAEAHHVGLARRLGQLGPLRVHVSPQASAHLLAWATARGASLGDIKPRALWTQPVDDLWHDAGLTDDDAGSVTT